MVEEATIAEVNVVEAATISAIDGAEVFEQETKQGGEGDGALGGPAFTEGGTKAIGSVFGFSSIICRLTRIMPVRAGARLSLRVYGTLGLKFRIAGCV
jgi:hypothetical protein